MSLEDIESFVFCIVKSRKTAIRLSKEMNDLVCLSHVFYISKPD